MLVTGLANLNRVAQQRARLRSGQADELGTSSGWFLHPIDRGSRHHQQPDSCVLSQALRIKLTVLLQLRQPDSHRRGQILSARVPGKIPDLDQRLERVVAVAAAPWLAPDRTRRPLPMAGGHQRTPRVRPRPASCCNQLIQHHTLSLLRRLPVLGRMLLRNLATCAHRQRLTHSPSTPQRPNDEQHFASNQQMRRPPHFAHTLREPCRPLYGGHRAAYGFDRGTSRG